MNTKKNPRMGICIQRKGKTVELQNFMAIMPKEKWEEGLSPMELTDNYAGVGITFAFSNYGGASGRIGRESFEHLFDSFSEANREVIRTQHIKDRIEKLGSGNSSTQSGESSYTGLAAVKILLAPNKVPEMQTFRGQPAGNWVSNFKASELKLACDNIKAMSQNNTKFTQRNLEQEKALRWCTAAKTAEKVNVGGKSIKDHLCDGKSVATLTPGQANEVTRWVFQTLDEMMKTPEGKDMILGNKAESAEAKQENTVNAKIIKRLEDELEMIPNVELDIYRKFKTPNNSKVDSRGLTKAYELAITYNPRMDLPYQIRMDQFFAPPSDRAVGIGKGQRVDLKTFSLRVTAEEMAEFIGYIKLWSMGTVATAYPAAYNAMVFYDKKYRDDYLASQQ